MIMGLAAADNQAPACAKRVRTCARHLGPAVGTQRNGSARLPWSLTRTREPLRPPLARHAFASCGWRIDRPGTLAVELDGTLVFANFSPKPQQMEEARLNCRPRPLLGWYCDETPVMQMRVVSVESGGWNIGAIGVGWKISVRRSGPCPGRDFRATFLRCRPVSWAGRHLRAVPPSDKRLTMRTRGGGHEHRPATPEALAFVGQFARLWIARYCPPNAILPGIMPCRRGTTRPAEWTGILCLGSPSSFASQLHDSFRSVDPNLLDESLTTSFARPVVAAGTGFAVQNDNYLQLRKDKT